MNIFLKAKRSMTTPWLSSVKNLVTNYNSREVTCELVSDIAQDILTDAMYKSVFKYYFSL